MELNLFDRKKVEKILDRYPQLEIVLSSGMVSKKLCRELLDIDKWLMDDLYKDLLLAGAIKGTSSSSFKAKDDTLALIRDRRQASGS
jgi:hypothetical protein